MHNLYVASVIFALSIKLTTKLIDLNFLVTPRLQLKKLIEEFPYKERFGYDKQSNHSWYRRWLR